MEHPESDKPGGVSRTRSNPPFDDFTEALYRSPDDAPSRAALHTALRAAPWAPGQLPGAPASPGLSGAPASPEEPHPTPPAGQRSQNGDVLRGKLAWFWLLTNRLRRRCTGLAPHQPAAPPMHGFGPSPIGCADDARFWPCTAPRPAHPRSHRIKARGPPTSAATASSSYSPPAHVPQPCPRYNERARSRERGAHAT